LISLPIFQFELELRPFIQAILYHSIQFDGSEISQDVMELQIITLAASMGLRAMSAKNSALAEEAR
jgi:hypothetical protein